MKILNLVLYSNSGEANEGYEKMQEILDKYYKTFEVNTNSLDSVHTIFYKFSPDLLTDYHLDGNMLHIKGKESLVPGVLQKTLKAFEYVHKNNMQFDYLVRSNVSTIINFENLIQELHKTPIKFYGGGKVMDLQWTGGGITDETWFGTHFVCGTSIILTPEAVSFILESQHLIKKDIVDDLAIAILIREHKTDVIPQQLDENLYKTVPCCFTREGFHLYALQNFVKDSPQSILYRNRCYNCREVDQIQMQVIVDILMEKYMHKL